MLVLLDNWFVGVRELESGLLKYGGDNLPQSLSWLRSKMSFSLAYAMINTLLSINQRKKTGGLFHDAQPVNKVGRISGPALHQ